MGSQVVGVKKRRVILGKASAPGHMPGLRTSLVGPSDSALMGNQGEEPPQAEEGCRKEGWKMLNMTTSTLTSL